MNTGSSWMPAACLVFALSILPATVTAEPYIAVKKGLKCSTCHVSITGGGLRTTYGNVYAQTEFVSRTLELGKLWTGEFGRYLSAGADIRGGWNELDVPGQPSDSETELEEALVYVQLKPFPRFLSFYFDGRVAPDDPVIREQYARLDLPGGRFSIKAGEFFLPYGLRLQDDGAFVRLVSGINFNTPDTGWEISYEEGPWSAQLAVTRGTAGGPELDSGKQYSLLVGRVTGEWRIGGSLNLNDSRIGDRQMQNIFVGRVTGPIAWLGEIDYIIDDGFVTGRRKLWASLLEANYAFRKGHNLKLTLEWFDPDDDVSEDEQNRWSIVWEYSPFQFLQARVGYRDYSGIPQNPNQNRKQAFAELHIPF